MGSLTNILSKLTPDIEAEAKAAVDAGADVSFNKDKTKLTTTKTSTKTSYGKAAGRVAKDIAGIPLNAAKNVAQNALYGALFALPGVAVGLAAFNAIRAYKQDVLGQATTVEKKIEKFHTKKKRDKKESENKSPSAPAQKVPVKDQIAQIQKDMVTQNELVSGLSKIVTGLAGRMDAMEKEDAEKSKTLGTVVERYEDQQKQEQIAKLQQNEAMLEAMRMSGANDNTAIANDNAAGGGDSGGGILGLLGALGGIGVIWDVLSPLVGGLVGSIIIPAVTSIAGPIIGVLGSILGAIGAPILGLLTIAGAGLAALWLTSEGKNGVSKLEEYTHDFKMFFSDFQGLKDYAATLQSEFDITKKNMEDDAGIVKKYESGNNVDSNFVNYVLTRQAYGEFGGPDGPKLQGPLRDTDKFIAYVKTKYPEESAAFYASPEAANSSGISLEEYNTMKYRVEQGQKRLDTLSGYLSETNAEIKNQTIDEVPAGNYNSKRAMSFFIASGYTEEQAAGIVGNLMAESNLNPNARNPNGGAYGIAQWLSKDRVDNFENVMGVNLYDSTFEQQLKFVLWELKNVSYLGGPQLKNAETIEEASNVIMNLYERPHPDEKASSGPKRIAFAQRAYMDHEMTPVANMAPAPSIPTLTPGMTPTMDQLGAANAGGGNTEVVVLPVNTAQRNQPNSRNNEVSVPTTGSPRNNDTTFNRINASIASRS